MIALRKGCAESYRACSVVYTLRNIYTKFWGLLLLENRVADIKVTYNQYCDVFFALNPE